jgi:hypothetical protein
MVCEPNLVFKRGEGWVYEKPFPSYNHGAVSIELRKPNPGELCCYSEAKADNNVEFWADWIICNRGYRHSALSRNLDRDDIYWCTFIPVNGEGDRNGSH